MKTPGADTRYIYAVARIRVLETRLLSRGDFERLLEEESLSEALDAVSELRDYSGLKDSFKQNKNTGDIFSGLLLNAYNFLYSLAYDKDLIKPFFEKDPLKKTDRQIWEFFYKKWEQYIFLNEYVKIAADLEDIKIFLRAKILGENKAFLQNNILGKGHLKKQDVIDLFDKPKEDELSLGLNHSFYGSILREGMKEYGQTGKITVTEKACDDALINYIKKAKYMHFGAEPLVCYALAKENEIKNLSIILSGKENNFSNEEIRSILRTSYV